MSATVTRRSFPLVIVVLAMALIVTPTGAAELRGEVRSVSGEVVTIHCEGGVSPNPHDPVKIGFEVPDVGFVALEGLWEVSLVGPGGEIQAAPRGGAHGQPQVGHVALVTTAAAVPPRSPQAGPPPAAAIHRVVEDRSHLPPFAQRPWMGVRLTRVDDSVRSGVPVEGVIPGGPADRAGIRAGDVVVSINGAPTPNSSALELITDAVRPGDRLVIRLLRVPEMIELTITPQLPDLDDPVVQTSIGVAYLNGNDVEPNEANAVDWLERAAAQGFADATDILKSYREHLEKGGRPVGTQAAAVYIAGTEEGKRPAWFILETGIFSTAASLGAPVRDLPPDIWNRRNAMSSPAEVFRSLEPLGGGWLLWVEVSIHWGHLGFAKDRVKVQCFDPAGKLQWKEDASNVMAQSADHSIQLLSDKIVKKLRKKRGAPCMRP
jgi:membrane-associated protease RseP (regulator of RpoE activity)